jgi:prolyl-tRNA editing enzyme YbaK/EbsC (Cys-tRNA(Pro) deacylase)
MAAVKKEAKEKKAFWDLKKAEQMANAYVKGATMSQMAEKYGVSKAIIAKTLKIFGVESHPRGRTRVKS